MRIVELHAKNVMGLREVHLKLHQGTEVHGQNGSGKSSLVAALRAIATKGGAELVSVGEEGGMVLAKIVGDGQTLEVKRKLGKGVEVTSEQNGVKMKVSEPQRFVERLFGPLAFDPLAFAHATPAEQRTMFLSAFPCALTDEVAIAHGRRFGVHMEGSGFEVLRRIQAVVENRRTEIGRDEKQKTALAHAAKPANTEVSFDPAELEAAESAVAAAQQALGAVDGENHAIRERNAAIDRAGKVLDESAAKVKSEWAKLDALGEVGAFVEHASIEAEILELEAKLAAAKQRLEAARSANRTRAEKIERINSQRAAVTQAEEANRRAAEAFEQLGNPKELVDRQAVEAALAKATDGLKAVKAKQDECAKVEAWKKLEEEAAAVRQHYANATAEIERLRGPVTRELMAQIGSPVEGLEIDDQGLKVNGVPLHQVNRAEQIKIGVRVAAALQADRQVKFVAIDNAESVTPKNRLALAEEAERLGLQWIFLVANDVEAAPAGAVKMQKGMVVA